MTPEIEQGIRDAMPIASTDGLERAIASAIRSAELAAYERAAKVAEECDAKWQARLARPAYERDITKRTASIAKVAALEIAARIRAIANPLSLSSTSRPEEQP